MVLEEKRVSADEVLRLISSGTYYYIEDNDHIAYFAPRGDVIFLTDELISVKPVAGAQVRRGAIEWVWLPEKETFFGSIGKKIPTAPIKILRLSEVWKIEVCSAEELIEMLTVFKKSIRE